MAEEVQNTKEKKGFFSKMADMGENLIYGDAEEGITVENSDGPLSSAPVSNIPLNIPTSGDGVFDAKFNEIFQQLIVDNNIPGIDYFEFREALKGMVGIAGINEAAMFQTVFSTLKAGTPTLTKELLMDSIDTYDKILLKEEEEFNNAIAEKTNAEVNTPREEAANLAKDNETMANQIQELNAKIIENNQTSMTKLSEAANNEAQIGQTVKNFVKTLAHVRANLDTDKTKIETLIQS